MILISFTSCPVTFANAVTKEVLPTPGFPSSRTALDGTCNDLIILKAFKQVVGALNINDTSSESIAGPKTKSDD